LVRKETNNKPEIANVRLKLLRTVCWLVLGEVGVIGCEEEIEENLEQSRCFVLLVVNIMESIE
jgi:hypothetical protein